MKSFTFLLVLASISLVVLVESVNLSTIRYKTGICDWVVETTCKKCCVEKGYEAKHSTVKLLANVSPAGGCICGKGLLEQAKSNSKVQWIGKKLAALSL